MDDQKLEETAFTALAVMEEAAKVTKEIQRSAEDAARNFPARVEDSVKAIIREILTESARGASAGLQEASAGAKAASVALRNSGLLIAAALVAGAIVIGGSGWAVTNYMILHQKEELADLRQRVSDERSTLEELQAKTWRLELAKYGDGTRSIILPRGVKVERTGTVKDGREAIVIKH